MPKTTTTGGALAPPTVDAREYLEEQYRRDPSLRDRVAANVSHMEIVEALVAMREARGLSQRELADLVGMKQPVIAKIEAGKTRNVGVLTIARIAAGLGAKMKITFEEKPARRRLARA
jgi:ribosome-binding protein aMBF1 (putative translation factor)